MPKLNLLFYNIQFCLSSVCVIFVMALDFNIFNFDRGGQCLFTDNMAPGNVYHVDIEKGTLLQLAPIAVYF